MTPRTLNQQIMHPRCPQCGEGKLFASMLKVADRCGKCGLDLTRYNPADGPTFFAITIIGFAVMIAASVVEYHYQPPMWLHAALWIPFTFIGCIVVLRAFKAILITLEYQLLQKKESPNDPA